MAIGEDADEEELGGALMHARTSGLCDYLARDESEALRLARGIVAHLHWPRLGPGPSGPADPPLYPAEELLGIASVDVRVPFDVREILARIVDGSRFEEFKASYGAQLVCGWASLGGYPIGIVANNGILFSEEAQKGAQFIQLCNRSDTPILFVQNITGFMVGTRYEQGGIIKDGAKLINAVSNSTVPHLTLMVGASYGAGNYAMAGRAYDPRFVFTWPNHRIAVMGPKQLAGVLSIVRRNAAEAAGRPFDEAGRRSAARRDRGADRAGVDGAVRHRALVGRRHHRPAPHPHRAGHRPHRGALGRRAGHGDVRGGAALMARASLRRVLVANRGEIARRVIRGAHDAGLEAVAVYAPDDAASPHVGEADLAVPLRGPHRWRRPTSSADALIAAAQLAGADALHPGYGFLSENPLLAEACADAGIVWVGPTPEAMRVMGHKARAKETVAAAGVPVLPSAAVVERASADGDLTGRRPRRSVPAAGQGVGRRRRPGHAPGRGTGRPRRSGRARRSGRPPAAFGSDEVFLERYLRSPRHVEVQVVGDQHGTVLHLFDRECSVQRRHQKVIEEAPAVLVDPETRAGMWQAATRGGGRGRLPGCGHGRVPRRRRGLLLLGDEHPAPGGARGHRAGHRARSGRTAVRGGRRPPSPARAGGGHHVGPRH